MIQRPNDSLLMIINKCYQILKEFLPEEVLVSYKNCHRNFPSLHLLSQQKEEGEAKPAEPKEEAKVEEPVEEAKEEPKDKEDEEGMWEETFNGHEDTKPRGTRGLSYCYRMLINDQQSYKELSLISFQNSLQAIGLCKGRDISFHVGLPT